MGKSQKPLTIWAPDWLLATPEMQKLRSQGHLVTNWTQVFEMRAGSEGTMVLNLPDLVIGDMAWFFTKDHYNAGLLKHALERARGIKYPPKEVTDETVGYPE